MSKVMPEQKPGKSIQNYGTPKVFVETIKKRFGKIVCDLAAEEGNAKCAKFITKEEDSLSQNWAELFPDGNLFLNPPFGSVGIWAEKCYHESLKRQGAIILLCPASVGTEYFSKFINKKAIVLALSSRLVFDGETNSFPKDLMLCIFSNGLSGFDCWRWKQ